MTQGILYIASGPNFLSEAEYSAQSVRRNMPDIPISIITDQKNVSEAIFDSVHPLKTHYPHTAISTLAPDMLFYDRTLFLDTDTYLTEPVYELFEVLDNHDIAFTLSPGREPVASLPQPWKEFNTGVIALKNCDRTTSLLSTWRRIHDSYVDQDRGRRNQPSFAEAVYRSDIDYFILSDEYNCRVPRFGYLSTDPKIVHGRSNISLDEIASRLSEKSGRRVFWPDVNAKLEAGVKARSESDLLFLKQLVRRALLKYDRDGLRPLLTTASEELIDMQFNLFQDKYLVEAPKKKLARLRKIGRRIYQQTIWQSLPSIGYIERSGVKVGRKRLLDNVIPNILWPGYPEEKPNYKYGTIDLLDKHIRVDDTIAIVGGGYGVTTVHAARKARNGKIFVYEGSAEQCRILNKVMSWNDVDVEHEIIQGVVGDDIDVYHTSEEADMVHPSDLPACDVLEMDCEGAELEIIFGLDQRPRIIIVEIHPHKFDADASRICEILRDIGYEILESRDQAGRKLSFSELEDVLNFDRSQGTRVTPCGFVHPPVVAARYTRE